MKILLVNDYATPTGGAELAMLSLRKGLRKRGHDARLFASSAQRQTSDSLADYECLGTTSSFRTLLQTANPWAFVQLKRVLAEFQPDVVHVKIFLTQLSPLILPLLRQIPTLYHVAWYRPICPLGNKTLPDGNVCQYSAGVACYRHHCLPGCDWLPLMLQMQLWQRWRDVFNLVVANSNAVKERLLAEGIKPVEVVWYGIPIQSSRPLPFTLPPTVVFAGRLVWEKGVDVLVKAFAPVVSQIPDARLLIAGDGPERDRLEKLIADLGLSESISMLGHLSRSQMEEYFAQAWVQAVPSRWAEPFVNSASSPSSRHVVKGTIWIFLAEALILPTGLITAGFLTRKLGPEGYGLFTLASVLIAWVEWSITSIFSRTTVKFVSEAEDWQPVGTTLIRLYLGVSIGVTLLLWFFATPIALLFHEPALATYLQLFALDIPLFSLASAHRQILIGIGDFKQRAIASAGRWIGRLVFIILFLELGFSVSGAILGSIGASLMELVISRCFVRPSLFSQSHFPPQRLFGYAVPLFLFALSLRLYDKLDLLLLKILGGTAEQSGIYGAAQNLAFVPSIFAISFSPLLLSTLSRILRSGEFSQAQKMGRNALRLVIGLLPFAAMSAGAAPEIVRLIYGEAFLPAAPLLALLICGALALVMVSVATAILTAAGKPNWTFTLVAPLIPIATISHILLIPRWEAMGAAIVTTVCASLGAIATILAVYHIWQILPPYLTIGRSLLVCGCAYIVAVYWLVPGFWLLLKLLIISVLIPLLFFILGEFSGSEIALVRSMIRSYLNRQFSNS
ncbi:glycosyltransferase [Coleofasciculus sp. F4-SAH-05]|uniref:glycosyltransferase n=1 Tax=Coleofasciculus sp. F4-SAH-05 TaxID=3069525 RepID=UPI0032F246CD